MEKTIKIFLSSPNDPHIRKDIKQVFKIVDDINENHEQKNRFVAKVLNWETHARPAAGKEPQALINPLLKDIDIFVGMMGSYFGTPTEKWGSGTEEEFRIAHESWKKNGTPEIMFYFSNVPIPPYDIDPDQLKKRNEFKKELNKLKVFYWQYNTHVKLKSDLERHIIKACNDVLGASSTDESQGSISVEPTKDLIHFNAFRTKEPRAIADMLLEKYEGYMETCTKALENFLEFVPNFGTALARETKNIETANRAGNLHKREESIEKVRYEMDEYSKKLIECIPSISGNFSDVIMCSIRFVKIVKDNKLEQEMPINKMVNDMFTLQKVLVDLKENVKNANKPFEENKIDAPNVDTERQKIVALHKDLILGFEESIGLLKRLEAEAKA